MFCTKCGKEIPDNVKFCTYCGNRLAEDSAAEIPTADSKKKTSKGLLMGGGIAAVCLLFVGLGFAYIHFADKEDDTAVQTSRTAAEDEKKEDTAPADTEETENAETVIEGQTGTENEEESIADRVEELDRDSAAAEPVMIDFDIEEEVLAIREKYYTVQDNMGNYSELKPKDNVRVYLDANGNAVFIKVTKGYNGIDYERWYLIEQGKLLFSFVFSGTDEHRLYFKQGILFRYIDNKVQYDNVSGVRDCKWEQTCMEESMDTLRLISE